MTKIPLCAWYNWEHHKNKNVNEKHDEGAETKYDCFDDDY